MPDHVNLDNFKAYEDGKHRRYSLLFSVNAGAFAIAKILSEKATENQVVGSLTGRQLSVGMIVFTGLMVFDIYGFGKKMREVQGRSEPKIFGRPGKIVLLSIGALICLGWFLGGIL